MTDVEVMSLKTGDLVKVETFSDGIADRRVVDAKEDTVYVCTEKEWLSARKENREPICAGLNKRYVHLLRAQTRHHKSVTYI